MGLLKWLLQGSGYDVTELARRLDVDRGELLRLQVSYRPFTIPKRSGGRREILAPSDELKRTQRRLLRRLLGRLKSHAAAMGFERGRSIATNARAHQGQAVVITFVLVDFFSTTRVKRVRKYFRRIGWNRRATKLLVRLTCHDGSLPQGAPTSPRLSNLVNYRLDARLAGLARRAQSVYTRYADDITFSFAEIETDLDWILRGGTPPPAELETESDKIRYLLRVARRIVELEGYRINARKKLKVRRRHHRQSVTGLVVNDGVRVPRETRRWLRAVEHRARLAAERRRDPAAAFSGPRLKQPTLTPSQLAGWRAYLTMVERAGEE